MKSWRKRNTEKEEEEEAEANREETSEREGW